MILILIMQLILHWISTHLMQVGWPQWWWKSGEFFVRSDVIFTWFCPNTSTSFDEKIWCQIHKKFTWIWREASYECTLWAGYMWDVTRKKMHFMSWGIPYTGTARVILNEYTGVRNNHALNYMRKGVCETWRSNLISTKYILDTQKYLY